VLSSELSPGELVVVSEEVLLDVLEFELSVGVSCDGVSDGVSLEVFDSTSDETLPLWVLLTSGKVEELLFWSGVVGVLGVAISDEVTSEEIFSDEVFSSSNSSSGK
jgi:hypothetical protein